jgi:hypothetical protein
MRQLLAGLSRARRGMSPRLIVSQVHGLRPWGSTQEIYFFVEGKRDWSGILNRGSPSFGLNTLHRMGKKRFHLLGEVSS